MKPGWGALDGVGADRLWLRPLGLISGRAATEAIASGYARPLTVPNLAFRRLWGHEREFCSRCWSE